MTLKNLLNLIPEIYSEKILYDTKCDLNKETRLNMDDYIFYFLKNKFKLPELVKKNLEEIILGILKNSN